MSTTVAQSSQVLEVGEPTIKELAATANREHELAQAAAESMLLHAIRAGEALAAVRDAIQPTRWSSWVETHFRGSRALASIYMRVARHQERLTPDMSISEAYNTVKGLDPIMPMGRVPSLDASTIAEAKAMRSDGLSYAAIGKALGVNGQTVARSIDPDARKRAREQDMRRDAAKRALREQERSQSIKRAVRKAGAATGEAWAMAERMQDVLAQAQRETEDSEARRALSLAGEHHRKMRDEIVRALGVTA